MIYVHRPTFDEMDYAQVAFFGRHFYWLEHATTDWLMQQEMGFAVLSAQRDLGLPVIHGEIRYRAPVNLERPIEVHLALRDLTRKGFTTPFAIVRQDDGVLSAYGTIRRRIVKLHPFGGIEIPDNLWPRFQAMEAESRDVEIRHQ